MDIVFWLRSLGLGKYEAVFRDNDIDLRAGSGVRQEGGRAERASAQPAWAV
jgi:hypothetical protein